MKGFSAHLRNRERRYARVQEMSCKVGSRMEAPRHSDRYQAYRIRKTKICPQKSKVEDT